MKYARRLLWLALLVSAAYSGRELLSVTRLAKGLVNPASAAPAPASQPVEAGDTNSAPGQIFSAKGGSAKASRSGGGVIVDANGNRLELVPAERPKTEASAAAQAVKSLPKLELPSLDDPRAGLETRKLRAEGALAACALAAFGLTFWARKYRSD